MIGCSHEFARHKADDDFPALLWDSKARIRVTYVISLRAACGCQACGCAEASLCNVCHTQIAEALTESHIEDPRHRTTQSGTGLRLLNACDSLPAARSMRQTALIASPHA